MARRLGGTVPAADNCRNRRPAPRKEPKGPAPVSTAIASDPTVRLRGGRHHFLIRRLHSLTGLVFGGYLIVHLLINATLIEGNRHGMDVYAEQVNKIHGLPFLTVVEWAFIYLPILFHTFY